ncbi:MAG: F0F1 ATP synthase subunit delta [Nocardioidaceae bacterium]
MRGVSAEGMARLDRAARVAGGRRRCRTAGCGAVRRSRRRQSRGIAAARDDRPVGVFVSQERLGAGGAWPARCQTPTVEVLAAAAGARWSSASDFVHALEQLGALALVIAAEREGQLSELEDELFRFGRIVTGDPDLRDALTNTQVPVEQRQALASALLEGKASGPAVHLVTQAVASRGRSFETAIEDFQGLAADRQQRLIALVRTVIDLNEQERARLAEALGRQYGRNIHLNIVVDPTVLGGIKVELGDDVIDGTVAGRLDDARRRMAG